LVIDPTTLVAGKNVLGAYDPASNTGVVALHRCSPNGATVGPNQNLLLGCTPGNNPSNTETLVINAVTHNAALVQNITGSDEVWFNSGDSRYYTGSSRDCAAADDPNAIPEASGCNAAPALGVIDGTSVLIEKIPQSSGSHSVAADAKRNFIYVPQVGPASVVGSGGDVTTVGQGICGSTNGCVAVYVHHIDEEGDQAQNDQGNNN
jgi:hypothetical protein